MKYLPKNRDLKIKNFDNKTKTVATVERETLTYLQYRKSFISFGVICYRWDTPNHTDVRDRRDVTRGFPLQTVFRM